MGLDDSHSGLSVNSECVDEKSPIGLFKDPATRARLEELARGKEARLEAAKKARADAASQRAAWHEGQADKIWDEYLHHIIDTPRYVFTSRKTYTIWDARDIIRILQEKHSGESGIEIFDWMGEGKVSISTQAYYQPSRCTML